MNMHDMARRDPALAVLMGAIAGFDFGGVAPMVPSNPAYGFGSDYGWGWGFGAGAPAAPPPAAHPAAAVHAAMAHMPQMFHPHPAAHPAVHHPAAHALHPAHPAHPANAAAAWTNPTSTAARTMLLDPNRDSTVKVERYSFSFSPASKLVLGTASDMGTFTQQPSTSIKGQRVLANAPIEGFVLLSTLQIANVNVFVGGTEDAFNYNPRAQNVVLDLPRLDPQNRATASGSYSGALPPGFTAGSQFQFIITLQGPSTLAGGYGQ
jgi:hypothetical protein